MSNLIAFIVLFGVLVFVHELGHFLMAKYFKVGVEKFSLGYGPKIFSKKYGGTEYLISALPLGGYVKMVGDEPSDELIAEETHKELPENSFLAKPPWQRILIVLMGPVANLVLPVILFTVLYFIGQPYLQSIVGYVRPGSPAAEAGIRPGDQIVNIAGEPIKEWGAMTKLIEQHGNKPTKITIERRGEQQALTVTPQLGDSLSPFGETIKAGKIGIGPQNFSPIIIVPDQDSIAYKQGLRSEDRLMAVNDRPVDHMWEFITAVEEAQTDNLQVRVLREGKEELVELSRKSMIVFEDTASAREIGIYRQELMVEKVMPDGVAAEKGMQDGDIIIAVNGDAITNWFRFQELVRDNQGDQLALTVVRQGAPMKIDLTPKMVEKTEELTGKKVQQRMLGVTTAGTIDNELGTERILNPITAVGKSVSRCYEITYLTLVGFYKLVTGDVSAKSLGGPILIYQLAGRSWEGGFSSFIHMLVLISITLGILNLLPIPVLDGGHLLFYGIEMIKGNPVSARTREIAQHVGIILLLGLMIFAFYNDLGRIAWGDLGWVNWLKDVFS